MPLLKRGRAPVATLLLAAAIGGCGSAATHSTTSSSTTTTHSSTPPPKPKPKPKPGPKPPGPPLGTTQHTETGGAKVTVTVSHLIDPLRDSGAALLPGTRAVGVPVMISNAGPVIYDSSATGDFSLMASSGPVTPVFAPHGVCMTPLMDFDNYITPGGSRAGCVVFSVASGAKVLAVRFSPHGQPQGRLAWSAGR